MMLNFGTYDRSATELHSTAKFADNDMYFK